MLYSRTRAYEVARGSPVSSSHHYLVLDGPCGGGGVGFGLFAAFYTYLTYRLVRTQGEPRVVVYTCLDPDRSTLVLIRIANIGRDVASDIVFTASRSIPALGFGLSERDAQPTEVMAKGPLIDGIPVLGPGDTRDITWGQVGGLLKALSDGPIDISFRYKQGRRTFTGSSHLEVASFITTDASANPREASARSLEKIAKSIDALVQDTRRQAPQD